MPRLRQHRRLFCLGMTSPFFCACLLCLTLWGAQRIARGQTESLSHDGLERHYRLHLPADYNPQESPIPLVIALHGGGGDGWQMERYTRLNQWADRYGFAVVYPYGIGENWNDGRNDVESEAHQQAIDDVGFIAALIDHLSQHHSIDRARIFATGISNGGMMSYRLACELSDAVAGVAVVVANMPIPEDYLCQPSDPIAVLVINGTDDPLIPWEGGMVTLRNIQRGQVTSTDQSLQFWSEHNACDPSPTYSTLPDHSDDAGRTQTVRHDYFNCQAPVTLLEVVGGGHTWPGATQYLPNFVVGHTARDYHANDIIWEFFQTVSTTP